MQLQESGQMYLETILILSKKSNSVRSIDISEYMSFSKPSVSRAVNLLKDGGYILISKEGYITLTGVKLRKRYTSDTQSSQNALLPSASARKRLPRTLVKSSTIYRMKPFRR